MKHFSHLNTSVKILDAYKGAQPFAIFIKDFFKADKKYGSKDRKQISHLCYCYFRLGKAVLTLPMQERILLCLFLCSDSPSDLLQQLKPRWNEKAGLSLNEKIAASGYSFSPNSIFPYEQLSSGIDQYGLAISHLRQPPLFIRVRPGHADTVENKLRQAGIIYEKINPNCLALPNGTKIEGILAIDKEVVIQDRSSQQVGDFIQLFKADSPGLRWKVWDCCAASGGKSLMAADILKDIDLAVSDVRESILINLRHRFKEAGIKNYRSFILDLASPEFKPAKQSYDLVIADLPCSGSGTWSRTPEQLYYFDEQKVEYYVSLQKKIVSNILPAIKKGGHLLYITCSVFKKENEEMAELIQEMSSFDLKRMAVLQGYDKNADTLFAALLQKTL